MATFIISALKSDCYGRVIVVVDVVVDDVTHMHDKIAHTAEHAFIGSLQRKLGQTLRVRKVEHKESGNTAFIVIPSLELQTVLDAQAHTNSLIEKGSEVVEHRYGSLEEARRAFPSLRANEERISGEVRVVEIAGHDVAACSMEHAENLRECDFLLITRISKNGDEYEVDFVVGRKAKETALSFSASLMRVCTELGANINTVENTARKLKAEHETTHHKVRSLGAEKLGAIKPEPAGRFSMFRAVLSNLDDSQVVDYAGKKIAESDNALVLFVNSAQDHDNDNNNNNGKNDTLMARLVLARSEGAGDLDCSALFRRVAGQDGRGGGKPHFVTGVVKKQAVDRIVDDLVSEIRSTS